MESEGTGSMDMEGWGPTVVDLSNIFSPLANCYSDSHLAFCYIFPNSIFPFASSLSHFPANSLEGEEKQTMSPQNVLPWQMNLFQAEGNQGTVDSEEKTCTTSPFTA